MPDEDGESLAISIRGTPAFGPVALVMLTSAMQSGNAERFAQAGFLGYFAKPVRSATLMEGLAAVHGVVQEGTVLQGIITRHTLNEQFPRLGLPPVHAPRREAGPGPSCCALVVEDNPVNHLIARRLLERAGWRVVAVADGAAAVAAVAAAPYDLILMDCQMPGMDGYEATAAIRQAEGSTRHTPIIALSATAMAGDRERCLTAGMDDYISKPIEVTTLMAALARWRPSSIVGPSVR